MKMTNSTSHNFCQKFLQNGLKISISEYNGSIQEWNVFRFKQLSSNISVCILFWKSLLWNSQLQLRCSFMGSKQQDDQYIQIFVAASLYFLLEPRVYPTLPARGGADYDSFSETTVGGLHGCNGRSVSHVGSGRSQPLQLIEHTLVTNT